MRWIWVFILLFAGFLRAECPSNLEVSQELSSCQELCEEVARQAKITYDELSALGSMPTDRLQGICGCRYVQKEDNYVVKDLYCQYAVAKNNQAEISFKLNLKLPTNGDLPSALIKIATFNKNVSVPDSFITPVAKTLFKGMYTVYASAITGVSAVLSIIFLAMAGGWFTVSSSFSKFTQFLSSLRHGEFSIPLKTEQFAKSVPVVLSIAFFTFPVPVSSPILSSAGVGVPSGAWGSACEEYQEVLREIQEQEQAGADQEVILELEEELQRLHAECQQEGQQEGKKMFKLSSPDRLYLPVAIAFVRGFVNYGVALANQVANYTRDFILSYVAQSMTENRLALERDYKVQKEFYEKLLKDVQEQLSKVGQSQCGSFFPSGCYSINSLTEYDKQEFLSSHPECYNYVQYMGSMCNELEKLKQRIGQLERAEQEQRRQMSAYMQKVKEITSGMGLLSPAVLPLTATYAVFASAKDLEKSKYTLTRMEEKNNTLNLGLAERLKAWLRPRAEEVVDEGKKGALMIMSGLASTLSPVWDKGWAFFLGQMVVMTSVPPGSFFERSIEKLGGAIVKAMSNVVSAVLSLIPFIGKVLGDGASLVFAVGESLVVKVMAYSLSMLFFKVLPFFAVAFAVFSRFIGYLVDLVRFILSIPAYAVFSATRSAGGALEFFHHLAKATVYPILIAFTPLVGFFAVELIFALFFYLPVLLILSFLPNNFFAMFLLGASTASLYIFATAVAVGIGWSVSHNFPESVFSFFTSAFRAFRSSEEMGQARGAVARALGGYL